MYRGWAQVAFSRDLEDELTPARLGSLLLILVRRDGGGDLGVYQATCPHRGAHLGYGGRVDGDVVVCPFHGKRIRLGADAGNPYCVEGYRSLEVGGAVYVLPEDRHENGFTDFMKRIESTHYLVPGFELDIGIAPEYVIENVVDADHFGAVHGLDRGPELSCRPGESGELLVEGALETERPNKWQKTHAEATDGDAARIHFRARVFSPTLVATEVGTAELPNVVVTSATPTSESGCVVRVVVAMAPAPDGSAPTVGAVGSLMNGSRTAFEQDRVIWEHLDPAAPNRFAPSDELVLTYHEYCRRFAEPAPG